MPKLSHQIQSLCESINANHYDRFLLLILADALEEFGDNRAAGMRWIYKKEYKPSYYNEKSSADGNKVWVWWNLRRDLVSGSNIARKYFNRIIRKK
jgi:hypothetical protein